MIVNSIIAVIFMDFSSKLLIVTGHFGSGKTNIAVNLALSLAENGEKVTVVDFDTVNPYFRSKDSQALMESNGVQVIAPEFANSNVDIPSIPAEVYSVFEKVKHGETCIFDVGGDSLGAAALGFFNKEISSFGYEMMYVFNMYRPITDTPEGALTIMREIERRSRLKCTCCINNSNLGTFTRQEDIEASFPYAEQFSSLSGLNIKFTSVTGGLDLDYGEVFNMKNITKKLF